MELQIHKQRAAEELSSCKKLPDLPQNQSSSKALPNIERVESLVQVNLSNNHLHGSLPSTRAFFAINSSLVSGNNPCGGDTASEPPPCKRLKIPVGGFFVTCLLVVSVVLTLAVFAAVFILHRDGSELKRVEHEDGMWEMQSFDSKVSKSITIQSILPFIIENNVISYKEKIKMVRRPPLQL